MFEVGQEVWCLLNGKGKVTYIDPHCFYEIGVTFPIGQEIFYTSNGFFDVDNKCRSLYFSEPVVRGQKTSFCTYTSRKESSWWRFLLLSDLYFCDVVC